MNWRQKLVEFYLAKAAGEADALSQFGLTHGTPKPPPTWAQSWQNTEHRNVTKKVTIPSMSEEKIAGFWGDYLRHTALNAGQAARDVRYFTNHPDAAGTLGTWEHRLNSMKRRAPSLANNLFYATIPPQTHHTPEDLKLMGVASAKQWFMHGYNPWDHPDPLAHLNAHLPPEESRPETR